MSKWSQVYKDIDEESAREKEELISFLRQQMAVESELIRLYSETSEELESSAVRHLLHMIQLDSMKHVDICQLVIDVLQGENVLKKEKEGIIKGLQRHIDLEKESINTAKKVSDRDLIRKTEGLKELFKRWMKDEEEHHKALRNLVGKTFFAVYDDPIALVFKSPEDLEERYVKYELKRRKAH